ncbi:MAG: succinate dehydrogenase, hydrophobic membrane anchor protein [Pseudomonadota bacterium]
MAFLTDRKRAAGLGSAKSGTEHHWNMTVTSWALAILTPFFLLTFGRILGSSHEEVVAYYANPFPAIVAALFIATSLIHFKNGVQVLIEDYVRGYAREALILAMTMISYALAAVAVFAIARLAL